MDFEEPTDSGESLRDIYTVSRLNREVRTLLEGTFPPIWLEGELSNLARPASGHWYFSLKDQAAQVRCAMFRNRNMLLKFSPQNGNQVLVRAKLSLYEARGDYQLIVEHMEEAGDGALRRQFEILKQKLDKEGLFDSAHKKPLPLIPQQVGIVTSATGAALHDILTTLKRRFAGLPVIVYPVMVQGAAAADDIAATLRLAAQRNECDVLILARGGGSLEDLWAFNEEVVARAIFDSPIPVVTGIGHEVDITIADFVADMRAPTPTGAAELISPDQQEWLQRLQQLSARMTHLIHQQQMQRQQQLNWLQSRLPHPARRLQEISQRLDELDIRRQHALQHTLHRKAASLSTLSERLQQYNPSQRLAQFTQQNTNLAQRLKRALERMLDKQQTRLSHLAHALDTISPLATLSRGYAIVTSVPDDKVVTRASDVKKGDTLQTRLAKGRLISTVDEISNE